MSIDGVPLIGLTAPTLLGLAILFLLTGRIVPRSSLTDKQLESDRWRQAYETEREARDRSDNQTVELLEGVKTNHAVMVAIFEAIQMVDVIRDIKTTGDSDDPLPKQKE